MIDHAPPHRVARPLTDRKAEALHRRQAADAGAAPRQAFWLTNGVSSVVSSGRSVLGRLQRVSVKTGSAFSSTTHRP